MIKERTAITLYWSLSLILLGAGGYLLSGIPGLLVALGIYASAVAVAAEITHALVSKAQQK